MTDDQHDQVSDETQMFPLSGDVNGRRGRSGSPEHWLGQKPVIRSKGQKVYIAVIVKFLSRSRSVWAQSAAAVASM